MPQDSQHLLMMLPAQQASIADQIGVDVIAMFQRAGIAVQTGKPSVSCNHPFVSKEIELFGEGQTRFGRLVVEPHKTEDQVSVHLQWGKNAASTVINVSGKISDGGEAVRKDLVRNLELYLNSAYGE